MASKRSRDKEKLPADVGESPAALETDVDAGDGDFDPMKNIIGYQLRRAQISVFQDFNKRYKPFDLKPSEFSTLNVLYHSPGLNQATVASKLGIKRANFVKVVDELEKRGLLMRGRVDLDRRSNALHLTENGTKLLEESQVASDLHESTLIRRLGGKQERDMLLQLLERLIGKAS